jgi:hypothetical protein
MSFQVVALPDPSIPPAVRRSAAHDIFDMGLRLRAVVDLGKRLVALENRGSEPTAATCQALRRLAFTFLAFTKLPQC